LTGTRLQELTRRAFLRRTGQLATSGVALPLSLSLASIGEAAAMDAQDFKALVCVFMNGGNDHDNTVVPFDKASHDRYAAIRQAAAIPAASLAGTVLNPGVPLPGGRQYALHPAMRAMAGLFQQQRAAVVLNVGPLVAPTTRRQYEQRAALPPKLFSHNDQVMVWQSNRPEGATVGWGGRIADLALAGNGQSIFSCISASGGAVFLSGESALQYQVGSYGPIAIDAIKRPVYGSSGVSQALQQIATASHAGVLLDEYNRVTARAITAEATLGSALASSAITTAFPSSGLGQRLRTIARIIRAHPTLGLKRQVFMVQVGGFDLHSNLSADHPRLLTDVADALNAFHAATVEMGLSDKVTAFTASDFGRTLSVNGDGSDHGWGAHHFVVGGAVKGGAFYGTAPPVSTGDSSAAEDQWHVGQGRLLPTTSTDQLAATLARWFGAADSELDLVLPNLHHFGISVGGMSYPRTLGFL